MLTAYDYPTAQLLDEAGIPLLLVGDSLGQVVLGYETTVRVTMAEMLHHTKAVVRGTQRALVVGDMPFLSYSTPDEALENAGRFLREAGAQAVKVEGGVRSARIIEALVRAGIPVMGHIGLTPQAINTVGKVRVQGKTRDAGPGAARRRARGPGGRRLLDRPRARPGAARRRRSPSGCAIPTIGIGAGAGLQRPGPGHHRPARPRRLHPEARPPYADLRETILGRGAAVRRRRRRRHVPGPERDRPDGRRGARRGARSRRARTGRPAPIPAGGIPLDRDL